VTPLFPWALSIPTGIEGSIALGFLFLGAVGIGNLLVHREYPKLVPAVIHVFGGLLALLARDLITLLVAWEVLAFSAFFLLPASSGRFATSVRLRYLSVQIVATVLFFLAIVVHAGASDSVAVAVLHRDAQPFMLGALLLKAAVFPLHFWLVDAYPAASSRVTPLLSVFATKVGVVSAARLLRFAPAGVPVVALLGAISAVVAVAFALRQHHARRLLSYHIVSQIGYMIAAIGLAHTVSGNQAMTAGLFHLLTHTFYKALLIMVAVAATDLAGGNEDLTTMGGLGFRRPLLLACGIIGAAAISGVPFTSGYASKYLLKGVTEGVPVIAGLLEIASIGTGLSFIKFVYLIFFAPPSPESPTRENSDLAAVASGSSVPEAPTPGPAAAMAPIVIVAAATVAMGALPGRLPGVPATRFFTGSAILAALRPLAASAILWPILKGRLTKPRQRKTIALRRSWSSTTRTLTRSGRAVLRAHDQDPRVQLVIVLVGLIGVIWFLR
jgi:formate hydrogenlyase subunit 3/multisubunit Na+/H+ antiporter MnhD subunit